MSLVGIILTATFFFWPKSESAKPDLSVYSVSFRTRLLDSIVGERALLIEATEDLRRGCLEEPIVAWVKPFTNAEIRKRDDAGVRIIIKNAGTAAATALRISVDRWRDLPPATVTTSANVEPARISSITSRNDTFDVITVPRIPPLTTAVVTYVVSLPSEKRSEKRSFAFPVRVLSSDDASSITPFEVSIAWADSAEGAVTGRPVNYAMSMVTPVSFEELHGDVARALVPLKIPYCAGKPARPSVANP
jgi:hypothetical protein